VSYEYERVATPASGLRLHLNENTAGCSPAVLEVLSKLTRRDLAAYPDYDAALATFSEVIRRKPGFAEGWNKRATAYYLMGELDRSLADCEEVVRRNPNHFGALSGFGLIYLQKEDLPKAAEYFEKALAVNPNLESVQTTADALRALLIKQRREAI